MAASAAARPDEGDRLAREREQFDELAQLPPDSPPWFTLRDRIIEEHLPLAKYLAARHFHGGSNREDILQTAYLGLVKAVDNFDPAKGFAFSTYATPVILGDVRKYFRDQAHTIKIPRDIQRLRAELGRAVQEWTTEHGTPPHTQQLAALLDVPLDDVVEALACNPSYSALDESMTDVQSTIDFDQVEVREAIKAAMGQLSEIEREIVWLRFFENQSQSQIAAKLHMSQTHVSRLQFHALEKLRTHLV